MTTNVTVYIDTRNGSRATDTSPWISDGNGGYIAFFASFYRFFKNNWIDGRGDQYTVPLHFGTAHDDVALKIKILKNCDPRKIILDEAASEIFTCFTWSSGPPNYLPWPAWACDADGVVPEVLGAAAWDTQFSHYANPFGGAYPQSAINGRWDGTFNRYLGLMLLAEKLNFRGMYWSGVYYAISADDANAAHINQFASPQITFDRMIFDSRSPQGDNIWVPWYTGGITATGLVKSINCRYLGVGKVNSFDFGILGDVTNKASTVLADCEVFYSGANTPRSLAQCALLYNTSLLGASVPAYEQGGAAVQLAAGSTGVITHDASSPNTALRSVSLSDIFGSGHYDPTFGYQANVMISGTPTPAMLGLPLATGPHVASADAASVATTGVTTDFFGRTRTEAVPTIGCIEISPPSDDDFGTVLLKVDRSVNRSLRLDINCLGNSVPDGGLLVPGIGDDFNVAGSADGSGIIRMRADTAFGAFAMMQNGDAVCIAGGHLSYWDNRYQRRLMNSRKSVLLDGGGLPTLNGSNNPLYPDNAVMTGHHYGQEAARDSGTGDFAIVTGDPETGSTYATGVGPASAGVIFYGSDGTLQGWEAYQTEGWARGHMVNPDSSVVSRKSWIITANPGNSGCSINEIDWTQSIGSRMTHLATLNLQTVSSPCRFFWLPPVAGGTNGRLALVQTTGGATLLVLDLDNPAGGFTDKTANFTGSGAITTAMAGMGIAYAGGNRKQVWFFLDDKIVVHPCDPATAGSDPFAGDTSAGTVYDLATESDPALRELSLGVTAAGGAYGSAAYDETNDGFHVAQGGANALFFAPSRPTLDDVLALLAPGQSIRLDMGATEDTFLDQRTPAELAYFNASEITGTGTAAYPDQATLNAIAATDGSHTMPFSKPGIAPDWSYIMAAFSGGHSAFNEGGGVRLLTIADAYASIIAGGAGGSWVRKMHAGSIRPVADGKPAWNFQSTNSWAVGDVNRDGQHMPWPGHTYDLVQGLGKNSQGKQVFTGGNIFATPKQSGTGSQGGGDTMGGMVRVTVEYVDADWAIDFAMENADKANFTSWGYYSGGSSVYPVLYDADTDHVFFVYRQGRLFRWNAAATEGVIVSGEWTQWCGDGSDVNGSNANLTAAIVDDPISGAGKRGVFQILQPGNTFTLYRDIDNPDLVNLTAKYTSGTIDTNIFTLTGVGFDSAQIHDFCRGPDNTILVTVGTSDLFQIQMNETTAWSASKLLTWTGLRGASDAPGATMYYTRMAYDPARNAVLMARADGAVFLGKLPSSSSNGGSPASSGHRRFGYSRPRGYNTFGRRF